MLINEPVHVAGRLPDRPQQDRQRERRRDPQGLRPQDGERHLRIYIHGEILR